MNRQRFLAELRRLLVFMTDGDRELTIERYTAMFDEAGDAGEEKLAEKLGSPTKLAIALSRGYTPGQVTAEHRQREALKKAEKAVRPGAAAPDGGDDDPVAAILRSLEGDLDEPEEVFEDEDEQAALDLDEPEEDEEEAPAPPPVVYRRVNRPMPVGLGALLLGLSLLVVGVPLAALALLLLPTLLLPGAAGVLCAGLSVIGALWCISYLADALLLFGLGFLLLALGLVLLWAGVWLDVHVVRLCIRGVSALCDLLLGRKEAVL